MTGPVGAHAPGRPARIGLVVNPVAGLGGPVGLGGSDGTERQRRARALGAVARAGERATTALAELAARGVRPEVLTGAGAMGERSALAAGLGTRSVYGAEGDTTPEDTVATVRALAARGVDLLLFAGGDGTARDVLAGLDGAPCPVLGVPTGVKMHSAVFAVNPRAAGEVAAAWLGGAGRRARLREAEVMDRDEAELRAGRLRSRLYGWLAVPDVPVRVQQRKTGSTAQAPEAVGGIAAEVAARIGERGRLVVGPGTTTRAVAAALGADVPLAGVNVLDVRGGSARPYATDVAESDLACLAGEPGAPLWLAVSPIGGQGFLLGRGNQQISPRVLRATGRERFLVLSTEAKLAALGGRPLLVDTGDEALDAELAGHTRVITGRSRSAVYRVAH
ncbi:ATP-NAD kinase family protein [Streptomyces sp. NPDC050504]|uniref:ATP-NAD kinase family protein n=1 Tax=Streptomyces sp. NPDC050504 TaxID=3365618 RepID=UPI0037BD2802